MKRYHVTPNEDGSSEVIQQPGPIRKGLSVWWSFLIFLIGWTLIFQGHVIGLIITLTVLSVITERVIKGQRQVRTAEHSTEAKSKEVP